MYIDCFWKETKTKTKTKTNPIHNAPTRETQGVQKEEDLTFHFLPVWIFLTMDMFKFYQGEENIV